MFDRVLITPLTIVWYSFRSSHPEVFSGKGVLKICSKFTGKHPWWIVISIKLLCNFIEITLRHGCSTVNLLHIFRRSFPMNTSGWLLLFIPYTRIHWHDKIAFSFVFYREIMIIVHSMDWFLYDNGLRHERVKHKNIKSLTGSLGKKTYCENCATIFFKKKWKWIKRSWFNLECQQKVKWKAWTLFAFQCSEAAVRWCY